MLEDLEKYAGECESCGGKVIWTRTKNGHWLPVDWDSVDEDMTFTYDPRTNTESAPLFDKDQMVSHFATCPNAKQHRRR